MGASTRLWTRLRGEPDWWGFEHKMAYRAPAHVPERDFVLSRHASQVSNNFLSHATSENDGCQTFFSVSRRLFLSRRPLSWNLYGQQESARDRFRTRPFVALTLMATIFSSSFAFVPRHFQMRLCSGARSQKYSAICSVDVTLLRELESATSRIDGDIGARCPTNINLKFS